MVRLEVGRGKGGALNAGLRQAAGSDRHPRRRPGCQCQRGGEADPPVRDDQADMTMPRFRAPAARWFRQRGEAGTLGSGTPPGGRLRPPLRAACPAPQPAEGSGRLRGEVRRGNRPHPRRAAPGLPRAGGADDDATPRPRAHAGRVPAPRPAVSGCGARADSPAGLAPAGGLRCAGGCRCARTTGAS